ncbi:MAG: hypothetical protein KAT93_03390 [Desulfuromonadales bacterium]|nr:hypothetical protein [Desulfuromonadales bacterium]
MTVTRKWYCTCSGKPLELANVETMEDEPDEPTCQLCGATQSSDPRHTIIFKDKEEWDD